MRENLIILNGANPVHVAFGETVDAEQHVISDRVKKRQFAPLKAIRLLKNSLGVPGDYRNVLCESCFYYPAMKRKVAGLKSRIININCGPLIYNLYSGRLKGLEAKMLKSLLKEVNAHLVFGSHGEQLLKKMDPGKPIRQVYPYIDEERYNVLFKVKPELDSKEMTLIGNDDVSCKGIDLAVKAFNRVLETDKELKLNIITNLSEDEVLSFDGRQSGRIRVANNVDIADTLSRTALYLHPSRGDTFPRASLEAMAAGVPTVVSEETGTKELLDRSMICRLDDKDLAERIVRYFALSAKEKQQLSKEGKEKAKPFNRKEQLDNFKRRYEEIKA